MKSLVRMFAVASAVISLGVNADEIDDMLTDFEDTPKASADVTAGVSDDDAGESEADEAADEAGEAADETSEAADGEPIKKITVKIFHILPFCRTLEGKAEVLIPGKSNWQAIEEGKYYPLGTTYRTIGKASRLEIKFGPESSVSIRGEASFATRAQKLHERSRSITLLSGTVTVKLPTNLPEGLFSVCAPGFTAINPAGESRYTYTKTMDGDEAVVRCVTQTLSVIGPHFKALTMRAANEIRIRTSQDQLMTGLYGSRGDVIVRLDQGLVSIKDYGTGASKIEPKTLDWKLSPRTAIRIHRAKPSIGTRMAVSVMTFDAGGELRNRCTFTENMVEVNSGELGPTSKKEREALAKRAAEIANAQEGDGETTETREAEEGDTNENSSSSDDDDLEF